MDDKELLEVINDAAKTNLTTLDLSNNELTELPPEIGKLTNLIELNLYTNQLTQLPPEIGLLANLTHLPLEDNQLIQLPCEIGNLTKLTYLTLNGNQLVQLPSEIGSFANLTELYLAKNQLTKLPPEIGKLTKLKKNIGNEYDWGLNLKNNNFNVPERVLYKENPQEIIKDILLSYKEGKTVDDKFLVSITIQRKLRKNELAKITQWLSLFDIEACFMVDKNPDVKLPRKNEDTIHEIKQYVSNKYQDYLSQVYDQKTK